MNKLVYDHIKSDERVNKMSEQNQIQFVVLNTLQRVLNFPMNANTLNANTLKTDFSN